MRDRIRVLWKIALVALSFPFFAAGEAESDTEDEFPMSSGGLLAGANGTHGA